jgi:hypothetical protein
MISAVTHFTPVELFEHLGVRLTLTDDVLHVLFADGSSQAHIPAPDGYPLDGSRAFIEYQGRYFVPADETER